MKSLQSQLSEQLDDALRRLGPRMLELLREEAEDAVPDDAVLGDWIVVVDLIDSEDPSYHWYRQFACPGMSPHSQTGLMYEALYDE